MDRRELFAALAAAVLPALGAVAPESSVSFPDRHDALWSLVRLRRGAVPSYEYIKWPDVRPGDRLLAYYYEKGKLRSLEAWRVGAKGYTGNHQGIDSMEATTELVFMENGTWAVDDFGRPLLHGWLDHA